jgi:glycosyltransferase involved in cell wall biosynthesis
MSRFLHIITGLGNGGAEKSLLRFVQAMSGDEHIVISMISGGKYRDSLVNLGVKVYCLNLNRESGLVDVFNKSKYAKRLIHKYNPNIVQCWMYHACILGSIISFRQKNKYQLLWFIRHGDINFKAMSLRTSFIATLMALFSKFSPDKIVFNSKYSMRQHIKKGFNNKKSFYMPNFYAPITPHKKIKNNHVIFLMVARWNKVKDHKTLIEAFNIFSQTKKNWKLYLAGAEINNNNKDLNKLIDLNPDIKNKIELLGEVKNINAIYAKANIHILSSISESFPNVVAESMLNGCPNIASNVGDAADIIDNKGWILYTQNPIELSNIIMKAYKMFFYMPEEWLKLQKECSDSIVDRFDISLLPNFYNEINRK